MHAAGRRRGAEDTVQELEVTSEQLGVPTSSKACGASRHKSQTNSKRNMQATLHLHTHQTPFFHVCSKSELMLHREGRTACLSTQTFHKNIEVSGFVACLSQI